jgi:hypothetical protein
VWRARFAGPTLLIVLLLAAAQAALLFLAPIVGTP